MTEQTPASILELIKDKDIKYVDLRFTDPKGKLQHVTMDVGIVDEDMFAEGVAFDGSSIVGWRAINESDICPPSMSTRSMRRPPSACSATFSSPPRARPIPAIRAPRRRMPRRS
jgi:glutamine synthetase